MKVYLRPYRGERIERSVMVKIPAGMPKGEHRILFSDADTLDRTQEAAPRGNALHGYSGDGFAAEPGARQQSALCFAGAKPADVLRGRQNAAQTCRPR